MIQFDPPIDLLDTTTRRFIREVSWILLVDLLKIVIFIFYFIKADVHKQCRYFVIYINSHCSLFFFEIYIYIQLLLRKGLKEYHFWLFNDLLVYGVFNGAGFRKYQLKQKLELKSVKFSLGNEIKFNGCDLICQTALKSFFCCLRFIKLKIFVKVITHSWFLFK